MVFGEVKCFSFTCHPLVCLTLQNVHLGPLSIVKVIFLLLSSLHISGMHIYKYPLQICMFINSFLVIRNLFILCNPLSLQLLTVLINLFHTSQSLSHTFSSGSLNLGVLYLSFYFLADSCIKSERRVCFHSSACEYSVSQTPSIEKIILFSLCVLDRFIKR